MSAPWTPSTAGHPEQAVAWALHALDPDEATAFAVHLDGCAGCRTIVAETQDVAAHLAVASAPADPPLSLRVRILAAAQSEADAGDGPSRGPDARNGTASSTPLAPVGHPPSRPGVSGAREAGRPPADENIPVTATDSVPSKSSSGPDDDRVVVPLDREARRRRRTRRAMAATAAAAVLAVVVTVGGLVADNRSLTQQRDVATAAAARDGAAVALLDVASRPGTPHAVLATPEGGLVGVVVDRGRGPEVLATGLAPNGPDETYVLWGLAGGSPVGLGAFDTAASGPTVQSVPSTPDGRFAGFAVSLEPGRTVPASPTRVVASGQLAG